VAREKRCPREGLIAYGAQPQGGAVVFPMFTVDSDSEGGAGIRECSTFTLSPQGKGLNEAGKPAGIFLPIADGRIPKPGEQWVIVEGVKDAAALWGLGVSAAGLPTAAMNARFAPIFAGCDVVVIPDTDQAGIDGARKTAAALQNVARLVRVAQLPAEIVPSHGSDVRDILTTFGECGPDAIRKAITEAVPPEAFAPTSPAKEITFSFLDSTELDTTDYRDTFLIQDILVAREPAIIGGRQKTLKTSLAIDMALSLTSGIDFLSHFRVTRPARVLFVSRESGPGAIQRTARAVAASKGLSLGSLSNGLFWGWNLPAVSSPPSLEAFGRAVAAYGIEVVFLDPAYLCLLAGDAVGTQTSNVFDMGPLLLRLSELGDTTKANIILIHHARKNSLADPRQPMELEDLSMAGFAEWARQWALLSRREAYQQGSGVHRLWLNVGGSAGHSGCYALDIDEGQLDSQFKGRKWQVKTTDATTAREESARRREAASDTKRQAIVGQHVRKLIDALVKFPQGETKTAIRDLTGLCGERLDQALAVAIRDGHIVACEILKGGRKTARQGYKLSEEETPRT
jgi:hypothetical protein